MTYIKEFTFTTKGTVEVSNVVMSLDKRNGNVVVEFDARGKDWVSGSPYPQAKLVYSSVVKSTIDLKNLSTNLKRYKVSWLAGSELALINHGRQTVTLQVEDEDDTTQTFSQDIPIDLDPVEYHFEDTTETDFSDSSTPQLTFKLSELNNPNTMMTPTIKVGSGSPATANMNVYFKDTVGFAGFNSGFLVLGGKKFSEIDGVTFTGVGGKGMFREVDFYLLNVPTLNSGANTLTIDLACTDIT